MAEALKSNPNNMDAMGNLTFALNLLGRHLESLHWSEIALERRPNDPYFIKQKVQSLADRGRHQEAIEALDSTVFPDDDYEAVQLRANCLVKLERYAEVLDYLDRPSAGVPVQVLSLWAFYRAVSRTHFNRNATALSSIDKAIDLYAEIPRYYLLKAMLHERLGDMQSARLAAAIARSLNAEGNTPHLVPVK